MTDTRYKFGIIKVGTEVVVSKETKQLEPSSIRNIARQISQVRDYFQWLAIVTSGAVGAGRGEIEDEVNPHRIPETTQMKQDYSLQGQPVLHEWYRKSLADYGYKAPQLLFTSVDFGRSSFRETLMRTLKRSSQIAVINNNDGLDDEEISYSDNDHLATDLARELGADFLLALSSKPGVLSDLDDNASRIQVVEPGDERWRSVVTEKGTMMGTGGMLAKCEYLTAAANNGTECGIVDGRQPNVIVDFVQNDVQNRPGTTFLAARNPA